MKTAEDFEFEAMLESVVAERVSIDPPAGLAQRLMARFEQVIEADRIQAARKPFAFAESVKSPRSAASLWLAAGAHAALALTIFGLAEHHIRKVTLKEQMVSTMIEPPLHSTRIDANAARGGGGHHDPTSVSAGHLPKFAERQILPPMAPPVIPPVLTVEPTVVVQSDVRMTNNAMPNIGAPTSSLSGNSLGNGHGTGIGPGNGAGVGVGSGYNVGGGPLHAGGSIKDPVVLYSVEPEFSEEARKARFSGNVQVYLWVDEQGNPSHIRVVRGAGMGLDEKAVEAVRQYKFKPAMQNGKPVKVDMYVDVEFNIY
jgi:protein TonB